MQCLDCGESLIASAGPGINDCAPSVTAMNQTDMFLERIHRLDGESCPPTSQTYHFVPSGMHHNHLLRVPHTHPCPPLIYPSFSPSLLLFPVLALCKYFMKDYFKFADQDVSQWASQIIICIVCLTQSSLIPSRTTLKMQKGDYALFYLKGDASNVPLCHTFMTVLE